MHSLAHGKCPVTRVSAHGGGKKIESFDRAPMDAYPGSHTLTLISVQKAIRLLLL
jgi:hypothetical protein